MLNLLVQSCKAHVRLCEHEIKDELLPPADDALDDVEAEHAQTVEYVDAFFKERYVGLVSIRATPLNIIVNDLAQLDHLGQARFSGYDGAYRRLNRRLFLLQVFDLFDDEWRILLGR